MIAHLDEAKYAVLLSRYKPRPIHTDNGYHSIEVNDRYRVLFRWTDAGTMDIVIDDYHN